METLMKKQTTVAVFVCLGVVLLSAALCVAGTGPAEEQAGAAAPASNAAIALISPASASTCHGTVKFVQDGANVKVIADLEDVPPGVHGFHIHEFGDCSAPDGTSAGSHYDAAGTMHHGKPEDMTKHSGDLGNLTADANGKAHYEITVSGISISGGSAPILGRGVIVHAKPDDFGQPVGNAGGRIGCGVIGVMKPAPAK
jgi:Cu-Zn family superoxide dismutase